MVPVATQEARSEHPEMVLGIKDFTNAKAWVQESRKKRVNQRQRKWGYRRRLHCGKTTILLQGKRSKEQS